MKGKITRIGKRIMTVMLSLAMVAGVWGGMKLDVRAEGTTWNVEDLKIGDRIYAGDKIHIPDDVSFLDHIYYYTLQGDHVFTTNSGMHVLGENDYLIYKVEPANKIVYDTYEVKLSQKRLSYSSYVWDLEVYLIPKEVPAEGTSTDRIQSDVRSVEAPNHVCNFEWVTTIDPTTGADGLEEYKCAGCGLVKESHSIPASVAAVKDFYGNIKEAPENGSITYDSGKLYTISDYLLKKMSERSDVAVTVNFEYQNAKYELTFPAGTDFTPVLTDEETMYGYFGVAAKLGLTVTAK